MLQKPIQNDTDPFNGLEIDGLTVRKGMLLSKAGCGIVIVSGLQSFEISGMTIETMKMHEIAKTDNVHTPPTNKIKDNGIRIPAKPEDLLEVLKTLTKTSKKRGGMWGHKAREYNDRLRDGSIDNIAQVILSIYGFGRGDDFKNTNASLSYSEKQIGEQAIQFLADEMSISFNFKIGKAKEAIQHILSVSQKDALSFIEGVQGHVKKYNPYLSDEEFSSIFETSQNDKVKPTTVLSSASLTPSKPKKSPFGKPSGYIPAEVKREPVLPKVKKVRLGTAKPKKSAASIPTVADKYPTSNDNLAFYDQIKEEVPVQGVARKAFQLAAHFLLPQAFELHAKVYFLTQSRKPIESVAKEMGLTREAAVKIHDETVEKLLPHFGNNGVMGRKPSLLKTIEEQNIQTTPKPKTPKRKKTPATPSQELQFEVTLSVPLSEIEKGGKAAIDFGKTSNGDIDINLSGDLGGKITVIRKRLG